jgi:hypothetical protein
LRQIVFDLSSFRHIGAGTLSKDQGRDMRKTITLLAFAGATTCAAPALADDNQYWQTASVSVNVGDGFQIQNELTLRTSDDRGFYELENALMLGHSLNKHVTVLAGYVHNPTYLQGDFRAMERRVRSQVNFDKYKVGDVEVSGRVRVESRWRDSATGNGWRLRPYVKLALPVADEGKTRLVMTNEAFVNLNSTTFQRQDGWERTRTFVGVNTPLAKNVTVEGGYMLQHGYVRNGPDTNDHVLALTVSAKF